MRSLTARQRQVLTLAAYGQTNVQIARMLGVVPQTVNRHLVETYDVLGAKDRANAVALAVWRGEISLGELALIADAATARGSEASREALSGPQAAGGGSGGAREVRDPARAPQAASDGSGKAAA